ncbi:MAG: hypothetical protein WCY41_04350 [Candidatus Micrarchaeia archaeon]
MFDVVCRCGPATKNSPPKIDTLFNQDLQRVRVGNTWQKRLWLAIQSQSDNARGKAGIFSVGGNVRGPLDAYRYLEKYEPRADRILQGLVARSGGDAEKLAILIGKSPGTALYVHERKDIPEKYPLVGELLK